MQPEQNPTPTGPWSWSPANERGFCAQVWDSDGNNILAFESSDEGSAMASTIADRHNRDTAAMRAEIAQLKAERRLLRGALRSLIAWGKEIPAPADAGHRQRGWEAFDKAKRAINGKR